MKKYISVFLCLFWMGLIFYNSSQSGSESNYRSFSMVNNITQSKNTTKSTQAILPQNKKDNKVNLILRKNAHGFEYLILTIILSITFNVFGKDVKKNVINILFVALLYSVTDEFHQIFVRGRTSSVQDILIDFIGALIGILMVFVFNNIREKTIKNY